MTKIQFLSLQIIFMFGVVMFGGFINPARGADLAGQFPNRNLWIQSKPQTITNKFYKSDFQIWQRVLPFGKNSFVPIATLTTTNVQLNASAGSSTKDGDKAQIEAIQQFVGDTYQIKKWRKGSRNKTTIFEGISPISGHYVKLFIKADKKQIRTSLATLEMGFAHRTYLEAEILQRAHIDSNTKFVSQTSPGELSPGQLFWDAFAPPAYADLTGPALRGVLEKWGGSGGSGSYRLDVNTYSKLDVGGELVRSVDETTAAMNQTSKTIAEVGSPMNVAKGVFAGTAAAMLFQSVWDLGASAMKDLFYAITKTIPPEQRDKMTEEAQKAFNQLETLSEQIRVLNRRAHAILLAMVQTGEVDARLALDINKKEMAKIEGDIKAKKDSVHTLSGAEQTKCWNDIRNLENQLSNLRDIQQEVEKKAQGKELCREFDDLEIGLTSTLTRLNDARNEVIKSIPLLMRQTYSSAKTAELKPVSEKKLENECGEIRADIKVYQDEIENLGNCNCSTLNSQTAHQCRNLCSGIDDVTASLRNCKQSAVDVHSSDPYKQMALRQKIVRRHIESLKIAQDNLIMGFCSKESTDPKCKNQDGDFFLLTKTIDNQVGEAVKACHPEMAISEADRTTGNGMATKVEKDDQLAIAPVTTNTNPNQMATFFGKLYSKIKELFA